MSEVVRLRPAPKKDATAAERMRRYRKKAKGVTQAVTVKRQKAPSGRHLSSTVTVPTVTQAVTPTVTVEPLRPSLIELRREVWQWVRLHREVGSVEAINRRQRIKDRIAQLSFLSVAVGFFVLIAVAAVR
jgi:hypothetical protein